MSERRRLTPAQRNWLVELHSGVCAGCKKPLPRYFHVDHRIPVSAYDDTDTRMLPLNDMRNLQPLCGNCHTHKTGKEAATHAHRARLRRNGWTLYDVCFECQALFSTYFVHGCYHRVNYRVC